MASCLQIYTSGAQTLEDHITWLGRAAQIFTTWEAIYGTDLYPYYMQQTCIMPAVEMTESHHRKILCVAVLLKDLIKMTGTGMSRMLGTGSRHDDEVMRSSLSEVLLSGKLQDSVLALTLVAEYIRTRNPARKSGIRGDLD